MYTVITAAETRKSNVSIVYSSTSDVNISIEGNKLTLSSNTWKKSSLNSKGSQIVATGINDLDSPPNAIILRTAVNPVGLPESLGSNGCIVIQQNPNNAFNCQLAFSFGSDKIAIRRKRNSNAWSDWKYFSAE